MKEMKNGWAAVVFAGLLALGCSSNNSGFSQRKNSGTSNRLRVCLPNDPTTLDPAKVQDIDTMSLLSNVYEGLVAYDENNKIVGVLASDWKVSSDGKVYTFKLKPAKFHDGTPVTAADVKESWTRAFAKSINSPIADTYLGDIVGAKELAKGTATELSGVKVVDDSTVQVTIDKARPYFLGKLTYACCSVVPGKLGANEIKGIESAIGTGPFRFDKFELGQRILLTRFGNYHGDKAAIEAVERPIVKDSATRLVLFQNGQTDLCTVEKQDWNKVQTDPKMKSQLTVIPRPAIYYLLPSGRAYAPFKDAHVRRAVMQAIDRNRIATEILKGAPVANRWLPSGILDGKPSHESLAFEPAAAKKELALSSFKSLPPLELDFRADNTDAKYVAEQITHDLKENLGLTVQPKAIEWGALLKMRNNGEMQSGIMSWFGDYLDAQNFLSMLMTSTAPANYDKWSDAEFDRLCAAADVEGDSAKRRDLYLEAEGLMLDKAARIPLYYGVDGVLVNPRVSGVRYSLIGQLPDNKVVLK